MYWSMGVLGKYGGHLFVLFLLLFCFIMGEGVGGGYIYIYIYKNHCIYLSGFCPDPAFWTSELFASKVRVTIFKVKVTVMMDLTRNMCSIFSEPFTTKLGVVAHHDEGFQCPLDSGPNWDWGHNIHPLLCWTCVSTLALLNSCQCPHDSGVSVLMIQGWTGVEMQQSCFALLNRCQCSDDSGVSVLIIQGCPGIGDTAFILCCFAEQVSVSTWFRAGVSVLALLNRCQCPCFAEQVLMSLLCWTGVGQQGLPGPEPRVDPLLPECPHVRWDVLLQPPALRQHGGPQPHHHAPQEHFSAPGAAGDAAGQDPVGGSGSVRPHQLHPGAGGGGWWGQVPRAEWQRLWRDARQWCQ